jgi:hypothetical protein
MDTGNQEENCLAQHIDMSDREEQDEIITNQDTRTRRAWVERALEGARRRLGLDAEIPEEGVPEERPRLYVVPPGRKR